jgi:ketosteroid isomerase-like protein
MNSLREAILAGDEAAFAELLAPDVVWVGTLPGQLCRNREQMLGVIARARANGRRWQPEIVDEAPGALLVDPHVQPPAEVSPTLHQVLLVDGDERVVEVRDYADRASALAALERMRSLWGST